MCINEHNKRLSNANFMCQMMTANIRQTVSCPFYSNTVKAIRQDMSYNSKKSPSSSPNPLLEIKHKPVDANTVLGFAKDLDICPYFISKYFSHDADLIFITQQALLKQSTTNLVFTSKRLAWNNLLEHSYTVFILKHINNIKFQGRVAKSHSSAQQWTDVGCAERFYHF